MIFKIQPFGLILKAMQLIFNNIVQISALLYLSLAYHLHMGSLEYSLFSLSVDSVSCLIIWPVIPGHYLLTVLHGLDSVLDLNLLHEVSPYISGTTERKKTTVFLS